MQVTVINIFQGFQRLFDDFVVRDTEYITVTGINVNSQVYWRTHAN